jgi:hypothetical protein
MAVVATSDLVLPIRTKTTMSKCWNVTAIVVAVIAVLYLGIGHESQYVFTPEKMKVRRGWRW